SARSAPPASAPPSPTPSSTPPASASATCRSRSTRSSERGAGALSLPLHAGAGAAVAVLAEAVPGAAEGAARGGGCSPRINPPDVVAQDRVADYRLPVGRRGDTALVPGAAEIDLVRGGGGVRGEIHADHQEAVAVGHPRARRKLRARVAPR